MATMPAKRDYYEVLGIARDADGSQIEAAYRKLAFQYHPDRNTGDDEAIERFKEAAEAFEVLNDAEKRGRYDRFGHQGVDGGAAGPHFNDVSDIFQAFGDILGDGIFGDMFGGRRGRRGRQPAKGGDVRVDIKLDLLEAAQGVKKTLRYERLERCAGCQGSGSKPGSKPETCRYCSGHGQVVQTSGFFRVQTTCPVCQGAGTTIKDPCADCAGSGQIRQRVEREFNIPAGVDSQTVLRVSGEGNASPAGGPAGDCRCYITVREHPLFQREGQNLICQIPITFSQAALGARIEVPTLQGRDELVIHPGTQSGEVYKLRGRGMRDPRHRSQGDLYVQIHIEIPKSLTARQEELLRELAEEERTNVSPHQKSFFAKLKEYFLPSEDKAPGEG